MNKYPRITPLLCAAVGTAFGFYLLAFLNPIVSIIFLFISLTALSFFHVLASFGGKSIVPGRFDTDFLVDGRQRNMRLLKLTAICCAAFSAGLILGISAASVSRRPVSFSLPVEKITAIEGVLLEDPRIISGGRVMASVSLLRCAGEGGLRASAGGEVTVFFPQEMTARLREFGRKTTVFAEGSLRTSEAGRQGEVSFTFSADSMHIVKAAPEIEQRRTSIRLGLIERFDDKNWGGLALALLLGIRDNLDSNLAASYRNAGCSYMLALSGMHLAVLAALITFLLKKPLGLKLSSIVGAALICLYCFIVGPMPSLNRAALMYLLGVVAILGFLPREPLPVLSLSFLIQIIISPASGYSISFILSYLALAGILVIGQPMYSLFAGKAPDFLLKPVSASCGAFFATAGVTGFTFGIVVPMGIITGLFLVPLTTLFMIGSIVWLVLDYFTISVILNFPLSVLYSLMESIVSIAGGIGGFSAAKPFIALVILVVSVVLSLLIVILEYRQRESRLNLKAFS